jgi:hypothetical protein
MEETVAFFIDKIGGVTFIVNVKPAEKAMLTTKEFIKALKQRNALLTLQQILLFQQCFIFLVRQP